MKTKKVSEKLNVRISGAGTQMVTVNCLVFKTYAIQTPRRLFKRNLVSRLSLYLKRAVAPSDVFITF